MDTVELPDEWATALGRIVFYGGRVDLLLGRLVPAKGDSPGARGLSGTSLVKELNGQRARDDELARVLTGYEEQYVWRNRLIHGAMSFASETLWIWHIPAKGRGASAQSYQLRLDQLQNLAESWRNLAESAHLLLHRPGGQAPDGESI